MGIIANGIVNALLEKELIARHQREEYEYALICEMESFITIGSVIILSILFGNFLQTICFLIFFLLLRKRSGGYHLNSFIGCYIGTIIVYLIVCTISNAVRDSTHLYIFSVVACVAVVMIGAVNHPNMNYSNHEYEGAKKSSRLMLCFEMLIIVFMAIIKVDFSIIVYSLMGINVSALFLIVAKLVRQEVRPDENEKRGFETN